MSMSRQKHHIRRYTQFQRILSQKCLKHDFFATVRPVGHSRQSTAYVFFCIVFERVEDCSVGRQFESIKNLKPAKPIITHKNPPKKKTKSKIHTVMWSGFLKNDDRRDVL